MDVNQIKKLREYHDEYDMCVFRTEGLFHNERGDMSFLIWDDDNSTCHCINTNPESHVYPSENHNVRIDSFDYEAITGIYSCRDLEGLEKFLINMKNANLIKEKEMKEIMDVYNKQFNK